MCLSMHWLISLLLKDAYPGYGGSANSELRKQLVSPPCLCRTGSKEASSFLVGLPIVVRADPVTVSIVAVARPLRSRRMSATPLM